PGVFVLRRVAIWDRSALHVPWNNLLAERIECGGRSVWSLCKPQPLRGICRIDGPGWIGVDGVSRGAAGRFAARRSADDIAGGGADPFRIAGWNRGVRLPNWSAGAARAGATSDGWIADGAHRNCSLGRAGADCVAGGWKSHRKILGDASRRTIAFSPWNDAGGHPAHFSGPPIF